MDNSVEALHTEYIISGETYLFCVDNDLHSFQDVADYFTNGIAECNARVRSEIESILKLHSPQPSTLDEDIQLSDDQHDSEDREKVYLRLKELCSVRTINALNYLESWLGYPGDAFWAFLLDKGSRMYNFKRIRNVGNKTVSELLDLADELEEIMDVVVAPDHTQNDPVFAPSSDSDSPKGYKQFALFEFAVEQEMKQLSARPKNVLLNLLNQCGNSIVELHKALHEPDFELLKVKNIGKGSISELQEFIKRMEGLWDLHQSTEGRAMQAASVRIKALQKNFGLMELEAKTIVDAFCDAQTPPLFKIIDTTIRKSDRDWEIISGSLNIFQNQTLADRRTVAGKTNLSPERVRQLRNKIYSELCETIRLWGLNKNEFDYSHYLDYCIMEYNDFHLERLNREERVYFNSNFIYRVLSLFFPESYTIIGDDTSTFMEPHKRGNNLSIVPVELSQIFDFSDFVNDLTSRINSKVYEEYAIDLKEYLLRFFKDDIHFDKMPNLLELCGQIIHKNFGIVAINNTVTIEQNATKTIPEILEEILSEKGEAMSLDEIFEQFKARVPDYSRDKNSLRGNIGRNSNIVPISRTSSYVLKEWEKKGVKGGTIRDIIFDFLVDYDTPLPIDEITSHVLLFREGTNANSIYSNMFADNTKRFSAYEHDGVRLYGLSQKAYDNKYELIEEERTGSKRGFKESIKLLERFITENGRFPFSSGDAPDGMRLNRFWGLHKSRREKGKLSPEQFLEMKRIEELYGDRELSKKDFIAKKQVKIDKMRAILIENGIDPDTEDDVKRI